MLLHLSEHHLHEKEKKEKKMNQLTMILSYFDIDIHYMNGKFPVCDMEIDSRRYITQPEHEFHWNSRTSWLPQHMCVHVYCVRMLVELNAIVSHKILETN